MAKENKNAKAEEVKAEAKATEEVKAEEVKNETPQDESKAAYKMQDGTREGATEVYFDEKPDEAVRNRLKELKMRWHRHKKCWYGFADRKDIKAAIEVA